MQRTEIDDLVDQLASNIADQIAAVAAEVEAVPRVTVVVSGLAAGDHTIDVTAELAAAVNGYYRLDDLSLALIVID